MPKIATHQVCMMLIPCTLGPSALQVLTFAFATMSGVPADREAVCEERGGEGAGSEGAEGYPARPAIGEGGQRPACRAHGGPARGPQ